MDGSMAGYYIREGTDLNLFVMFFQGGGGCSEEMECTNLVNSGSSKGSSKSHPDPGEFAFRHVEEDTFLDEDCDVNPDFCRATAVYIPYCTQDAHRGTALKNEDGPEWYDQYYFDGHLNFQSIVQKLIDENGLVDSANTKVLLTGSSAGGTGALYNGEWLMNKLPATSVKAAPVAGWFFPGALPGDLPEANRPSDYKNFAAGTHGNKEYSMIEAMGTFPDQHGIRDVLPAACLDRFVNETHDMWYACASMHNAYRYMEMPIFTIHSQYDRYIIFSSGGAPEQGKNPAEIDMAYGYIEMVGEAHRRSFQQILNDDVAVDKEHGDGIFSPSCIMHNINPESAFIDGIGYPRIVADWFFQRGALTERYRQVEECGDTDGFTIPCNADIECQYAFLEGTGTSGTSGSKAMGAASPEQVTTCTQAMGDATCLDKGGYGRCQSCAWQDKKRAGKDCEPKLREDICWFNYQTTAVEEGFKKVDPCVVVDAITAQRLALEDYFGNSRRAFESELKGLDDRLERMKSSINEMAGCPDVKQKQASEEEQLTLAELLMTLDRGLSEMAEQFQGLFKMTGGYASDGWEWDGVFDTMASNKAVYEKVRDGAAAKGFVTIGNDGIIRDISKDDRMGTSSTTGSRTSTRSALLFSSIVGMLLNSLIASV